MSGKFALHIAAKNGNIPDILALLNEGYDINAVDKFGVSPLDLAITHQHTAAALLMLNQGQLENGGAKSLSLALQVKDDAIAQAVILHPTFQPDVVAFRAFRWKQIDVLNFLVLHNVNMPITHTLLMAKMLAHRFSLEGSVHVYPQGFNGNAPVKISLQGHHNQITARECYLSFKDYIQTLGHQAREHFNVYQKTLDTLAFASLPNLNGKLCMERLYESYLQDTPTTTFIPSGWTGHAAGIVIHGDKLYKCNRGIGSDGKNGIVAYKINNFQGFSETLFNKIINAEGSPHFFQKEIDDLLDLVEIARYEAPPQEVGNCAWISAIEGVHATLIAEMSSALSDQALGVQTANQIYQQWIDFDLDHSILQLPTTFEQVHQKEMIDEVLSKIVFAHHNSQSAEDIRHTLYVLRYVDKPEEIIQRLEDPDFHATVSDVIRGYANTYEKSHWYDPVFFWTGYATEPYATYADQVAFGKSMHDLIDAHPNLLAPTPLDPHPDALKWEEVFPDCMSNCTPTPPPSTPMPITMSEPPLVLPELLDYHYNLI